MLEVALRIRIASLERKTLKDKIKTITAERRQEKGKKRPMDRRRP